MIPTKSGSSSAPASLTVSSSGKISPSLRRPLATRRRPAIRDDPPRPNSAGGELLVDGQGFGSQTIDPETNQFLSAIAENFARRRIGRTDRAVAAESDDGVHRGFEYGVQPPFVFAQITLDADTLRDILDENDDAADAAIAEAPGLGFPSQPISVAVNPHIQIVLAANVLAAEGAAKRLPPFLWNAGRDVENGFSDNVAAEFENAAPSGAGRKIKDVAVEHGHGRWGLFDEMAQLLRFGAQQGLAGATGPDQQEGQARQRDISRGIEQEVEIGRRVNDGRDRPRKERRGQAEMAEQQKEGGRRGAPGDAAQQG